MDAAPDAGRFDEESESWVSSHVDRWQDLPFDIPDTTYPAWSVEGRPRLAAIDHDDTAVFYATNRGVSRCLIGDEARTEIVGGVSPHTFDTIQMGYTQLFLMEKRAVIVAGEVVRFWAQHPDRPAVPNEQGKVRAFLPQTDRSKWLHLGVSHPLKFGVGHACNLSARTGEPIVVAIRLTEHTWH